MAEAQEFCTFFLDGSLFGTGVAQVQEVVLNQQMTSVPLAPGVVSGLINLRGQIVTAIDLRRRLGLADRAQSQVPMNVVVRVGDEVLSLLVDRVGDVIEVSEDTFEKPPETLERFERELVRGAYKLPGRLLLALDIERVVDLTKGATGIARQEGMP